MRYKLIVFDLDETLWSVQQRKLEPVSGPFELVDSHTAISDNAEVTLFRGVRALLKNLTKRHKFVSLASRSDPDVSEELMRLFDIYHHFSYCQWGWQEKGTAVLNVLKALRDIDKGKISPQEVLFIDDYPANVANVKGLGAATLLFGRDIDNIQELAWILE